jgi:signal transduction histidine kinase
MSIRNAVVESLRPFVKMFEEKNQSIQNDVPEDLPLVWGDETRVIQVLTNLVSNAHKYSYPDTTIRVHAFVDENHIAQTGEKVGRRMVVGVKDQGIGMSEEDQAKMFKVRYFRSTNKEAQNMASGTGLGMMLTYNIMRKHNGDIWLESKLGEGTTFLISFPLAEDIEKQIKADSDTAAD